MSTYMKISKAKNILMGLAILWVVFYHSKMMVMNPIFAFIKRTGYGGVDIFMFLSGFGLFCSLLKNSNEIAFYQRRLRRLLPSYLPFIIVWLVIKKIETGITISEIVGNLLCIGWWNGLDHQFNWYIQAIAVFYLATPFLFKLMMYGNCSKRSFGILLASSLVLSIPFFKTETLIAASRLPVFVLGMYFACCMIKEEVMHTKSKVVYFIGAGIGILLLYLFITFFKNFLWTYGLFWYPFLLITPGICIGIASVYPVLKKRKSLHMLVSILEIMGCSSLEIYFIHILLYEYVPKVIRLNTLGWLVFIIICIFIGVLYNKLVSALLLTPSKHDLFFVSAAKRKSQKTGV